MEAVHIERLDPWGWLAAVIKDVGLLDMSDARLTPEAQAAITPGAAGAGMILQGLGCATRPLSLTPQFVATNPLDRLCHEGVHAEMCPRLKLGRTLAEAHASGGARWCHELALAVGAPDGSAAPVNPLDPTRGARSGAYGPDSDEPAIRMTHGSAQDHRPDGKPAVWALLVSQDGGGPLVRKSGDGPAADPPIVRERAEALLAPWQLAPTPRALVADSTRDHADQAANLSHFGWITRRPNTRQLVVPVLQHARTGATWPRLDETTGDQRLEVWHDGMAQRWRVVSSPAALERAEAAVSHAGQRDSAAIDTHLGH
jgi:hypothetical protein